MTAGVAVAIQHTIQRLSLLKYFEQDIVVGLLEQALEGRGINLTPAERKRAVKKLVRTLERLGFRNHRGGEQTVQIVRYL